METVNRIKVEETVYSRLLYNIRDGVWKSGDKLPSENELCQLLNVSRVSVRGAIQRLRALGLVETMHGKGTYVTKGDITSFTDFDQPLDLTEKEFNEINELREAMESKAIQLIISKKQSVDLSPIQNAYYAMRVALRNRDEQEFTRQDYLFHTAIIHASANEMFSQIIAIFRNQYYRYFQEMNKFIFKESAPSKDLLQWCESEYDSHALLFNCLTNAKNDNVYDLVLNITSGNKKRFESYLQSTKSVSPKPPKSSAEKTVFYAGTYSHPVTWGDGSIYRGNGKGLAEVVFDEKTASINMGLKSQPCPNPSYLTTNSDHTCLYCVHELDTYQGINGGAVSAYQIDKQGDLTLLSTAATHEASPCHVRVSPDNRLLLVSNFNGGSLSVFKLQTNGSIESLSHIIRHTGYGANPLRQEKAHVHSATFSPDGKWVVVADLGCDQLSVHDMDDHMLSPDARYVFHVPAGSGPRMTVFHQTARVFYCLCELSNTVLVYRNDEFLPNPLQILTTLPLNNILESSAADLVLSADGNYLYCSNRGHDSITIFAVDEKGLLTYLSNVPCNGKDPRSLSLSSSGKWLFSCNQNSDSISVFSITNGIPAFTSACSVPTPTCLCEV